MLFTDTVNFWFLAELKDGACEAKLPGNPRSDINHTGYICCIRLQATLAWSPATLVRREQTRVQGAGLIRPAALANTMPAVKLTAQEVIAGVN
jgi:hypothetical protein